MNRKNIKIEEETWEYLKVAALKQRITLQAFIDAILKTYRKAAEKKQEKEEK